VNATQIPARQLRLMRNDDLPAAVELSTLAGWKQTAEDWRMLMGLAPAGCFALEVEGKLVSTTTLLSYGRRLAWIGMVLTHPDYRGRGFASRLLRHVLEYADSSAIETIKLDATELGRPIYERFGFSAEQPVMRWVRPGDDKSCIRSGHGRCDENWRGLDIEAFGADRWPLLQKLSGRCQVSSRSNAFLFARAGRVTAYLGPCVASTREAARELITGCLATHSTSWCWDLLPSNQGATALASELGFAPQRHLTRMYRGKPLNGRDDMVYALAGFELG